MHHLQGSSLSHNPRRRLLCWSHWLPRLSHRACLVDSWHLRLSPRYPSSSATMSCFRVQSLPKPPLDGARVSSGSGPAHRLTSHLVQSRHVWKEPSLKLRLQLEQRHLFLLTFQARPDSPIWWRLHHQLHFDLCLYYQSLTCHELRSFLRLGLNRRSLLPTFWSLLPK